MNVACAIVRPLIKNRVADFFLSLVPWILLLICHILLSLRAIWIYNTLYDLISHSNYPHQFETNHFHSQVWDLAHNTQPKLIMKISLSLSNCIHIAFTIPDAPHWPLSHRVNPTQGVLASSLYSTHIFWVTHCLFTILKHGLLNTTLLSEASHLF